MQIRLRTGIGKVLKLTRVIKGEPPRFHFCPLICASSQFSSEKLCPCLKVIYGTLDICLVFVDALLRAKLFKSKSVADQSEASIALITTLRAGLRSLSIGAVRGTVPPFLLHGHRTPYLYDETSILSVAGRKAMRYEALAHTAPSRPTLRTQEMRRTWALRRVWRRAMFC